MLDSYLKPKVKKYYIIIKNSLGFEEILLKKTWRGISTFKLIQPSTQNLKQIGNLKGMYTTYK